MAKKKGQQKQQQSKKGKQKTTIVRKNFEKNEIRWLILIILLTLFAFVPGLQGDLLNFDDHAYISDNQLIQAFSWENISAIFSGFHYGGYYPLTLFSFMIDYQIAGLNPFIYHFTNLLLHLANMLLVYFLLKKLFDNKVISLTVALLFGIHPLHVESVSWATERKDVLYSLFYLISLLQYIKFIDKKDKKYFIYTFVFFLLSVLSKSMAIMLAPTLLLMDYFKGRKLTDKMVVIEKIPFFILSIAFGIVAISSQADIGAIATGNSLPFMERIAFAAFSFTIYVVKILIPFGQAAFYPYPEYSAIYWLFMLFVIGYLYGIFRFIKTNKILAFGSIFFLLHIALGVQLLQVNNFVMADRFTYLASIGIFILLAYGYKQLLERYKKSRNAIYVFAIAYVVFLFISTNKYIEKWETSLAVWNNVIEKYPDRIPKAYYWRGHTNADKGNYSMALQDFSQVIGMEEQAYDVLAYHSRAVTYANMNRLELALNDINRGLELDSTHTNFYILRGQIYAGQSKLALAEKDFNTLVSLDTNNFLAYYHRSDFYRRAGQFEKSLADFNKIIELKPDFAEAYYYRAMMLIQLKRNNEACKDLQKAYDLGIEDAKTMIREYCM